MQGTFEEGLFKDIYQRNNKRGGLKNLRCFPSCGWRHKERGFCGRAVELKVTRAPSNIHAVSSEEAAQIASDLFSWTEFWKVDEVPRYSPGEEVAVTSLEALTRNKEHPSRPLIEGEILAERSTPNEVCFEFNRHRRGWHYGWMSNKHSCDALHCLQSYVFVRSANRPGFLRCAAVFQSPSFRLFCRRRRRFVLTPSAPSQKRSREQMEGTNRSQSFVPVKREKLVVPTPPLNQDAKSETAGMEVIIKRFGLIMGRVKALESAKFSAISKSAAGSHSFDDLDLFPSSVTDALDLFERLPDTVWDKFESVNGVQQDDGFGDFDLSLDLFLHESSANSSIVNSFNSSSMTQPEIKKATSDEMLEDVAEYLQNDSKFKKALGHFTRQAQTGVPNYRGFLRLVQEYLETYRCSRNISKAEFEENFDRELRRSAVPDAHATAKTSSSTASSSASSSSNYGLFSSAYSAIASLLSSSSTTSTPSGNLSTVPLPASVQPSYLQTPAGISIPNLTGKWKQTSESEKLMQEFRLKLGTPWTLSKLFEYMESVFETDIDSASFSMITRLSGKWLLNTSLAFILDGEERDWGISLPPPFAQFSQGWKYRAWVENNKIVLTHSIGDQRLQRHNWLSKDSARLHSLVILEIFDSNSRRYVEMGRVAQQAIRV